MRNFTEKRRKKLDEQISIYSCLKKMNDAVVIQMSPDLFSELIAYSDSFLIYSRDGFQPHKYKGCDLILASGVSFLSIAYIDTRTGMITKHREIKEE